MFKIFFWRLAPLAIAIVGLGGLGYVLAQQTLRLSANDPQIQMAEDAATELARGAEVASVVPASSVPMDKSLAPFLVVYDTNGVPLGSSGELDRDTPRLPSGVLRYVDGAGEDRITWAPRPGVRIAAVIVRFSNSKISGYVLSGRSLAEIENRSQSLLWVAIGAILVSFFAATAATAIGVYREKN